MSGTSAYGYINIADVVMSGTSAYGYTKNPDVIMSGTSEYGANAGPISLHISAKQATAMARSRGGREALCHVTRRVTREQSFIHVLASQKLIIFLMPSRQEQPPGNAPRDLSATSPHESPNTTDLRHSAMLKRRRS
jgi:hypothetical protein